MQVVGAVLSAHVVLAGLPGGEVVAVAAADVVVTVLPGDLIGAVSADALPASARDAVPTDTELAATAGAVLTQLTATGTQPPSDAEQPGASP